MQTKALVKLTISFVHRVQATSWLLNSTLTKTHCMHTRMQHLRVEDVATVQN